MLCRRFICRKSIPSAACSAEGMHLYGKVMNQSNIGVER